MCTLNTIQQTQMTYPDFIIGVISGFLTTMLLFLIANEEGMFDEAKIKHE